MRKLHFKSILSMALAGCLMFGSSIMCYAYDGNTNGEVNATVADKTAEEGTPLETITDGAISTRSGYISDLAYTETSTGKFGGSFTVPSSENLSLIKVHWRVNPQNGANSSAVFKMTISGNGISRTVYLSCNTSATAYSIDTLPAGSYTFNVSPYSNVKGSYLCFYRFYAF